MKNKEYRKNKNLKKRHRYEYIFDTNICKEPIDLESLKKYSDIEGNIKRLAMSAWESYKHGNDKEK
ncbi:MAG: hypothetical protein LBF97_01640 [Elusimicrobiota bacterium]|nr:hypothetical protein [Elusimicrobiota bacterium]